MALLYQRPFTEATIRLPQGQLVTFLLQSCTFDTMEARSSVIKDAGDDPDVTDKAEICARVAWSAQPGVTFLPGRGVGLVTRSGLPMPPGEPAINPVPRAMMRDTIAEVLAEAGSRDRGVVVEISVPDGEAMAQKTFNPRLGIVGGISILGTSGIVVPYSNAAWVASVLQAIDVAVAQGCTHLVLTVGGRSERSAQQLYTLPEVAFVQIGPFFGDALKHCTQRGVQRVTLLAMIGKLAKFAAGNASVHSTASRQDFAFLAGLAQQVGADAAMLANINAANTAQEVAELITNQNLLGFFALLCTAAWRFGQALLGDGVLLEVILTGVHGEVLGRHPA
jgi:cobalt-precorrin-5B (C1)-methyltransferase